MPKGIAGYKKVTAYVRTRKKKSGGKKKKKKSKSGGGFWNF